MILIYTMIVFKFPCGIRILERLSVTYVVFPYKEICINQAGKIITQILCESHTLGNTISYKE